MKHNYVLPEGFKPITLQAIFDKAYDHFILNGGKPSCGLDGRCMYVSEDGSKCAVGLTIPDGHPAQDSKDLFEVLVSEFPELWDASLHNVTNLDLRWFQSRLHDTLIKFSFTEAYFIGIEEMKKSYREVAEKFNLDIPEGLKV